MAKRGRKEKDNWKKKRRQEYLEKKEFRYYIFCEGQATEPKYFQGFKRYIEDNPIYRDMVLIEIEGCQAETMRVIGKAEEYVRENNCVLDNEKEREQIKYSPLFLCVLRRQNYAITEEMDKKIAEYLPSYYGDTYRLEITENENEDMPGFVREYAERIRKSNETQGKNGIFFGHGTREIATVRAILLEKEFVCDSEIIDVLISTVADTLLIFKGKYRYKT